MNRDQIAALEWAISELSELGVMGNEIRHMDELCRLRAALSAPKAEAKKNIGTIANVDHGKTSLTAIAVSLLAAREAEAKEPCPVCAKPFAAGDTCATDIELGKCHAECLAGSPTVDLETGEPMDGPIGTFPHVAPKAEAVTVKPLVWIGDQGSSAETPFGTYTVAENIEDRWEWTFHKYPYGSPDETAYETEDEAKAAAQVDYAARILSVIATSPVPALTDEAVADRSGAPEAIWMGAADADGDQCVWFDPDKGGTKYVRSDLIPALTDEAVERAVEAIEGELGGAAATKEQARTILEYALLAAFPSKGAPDGE